MRSGCRLTQHMTTPFQNPVKCVALLLPGKAVKLAYLTQDAVPDADIGHVAVQCPFR